MSIICASLACFFLWGSYSQYSYIAAIKKDGVEAVGTIIGHKESNYRGFPLDCYDPIVKFMAYNGKYYEARGKFCAPKDSTINYKGRRVRLIYSRKHPNRVMLEGDKASYRKNDFIYGTIAFILLIFAALPLFGVETFYEKRLKSVKKDTKN